MLGAEADAVPVSGIAAPFPAAPFPAAPFPAAPFPAAPLPPASVLTASKACAPNPAVGPARCAPGSAASPDRLVHDWREQHVKGARHGLPGSRPAHGVSWRQSRRPGFSYEGGVPASAVPVPVSVPGRARARPTPAHRLQIALVIRFGLAGGLACDQGGELLDVVPDPQARDGGLVGWPRLGEQFG
jgi:hypothetical protein